MAKLSFSLSYLNPAQYGRQMGTTISISRIIVGLVVIWLVVIILMTGPLFYTGDNAEHIAKQLSRAMNHLDLLKKQNDDFRALLADVRHIGKSVQPCDEQAYQQLQSKLDQANEALQMDKLQNQRNGQALLDDRTNSDDTCLKPSLESLKRLRRIAKGANEMWYYFQAEMKNLIDMSTEGSVKAKIKEVLEDGIEHKRSILLDLQNFSSLEGRREWIASEMKALTDLVQQRITNLQNPKDCSTAKKVVCNLNKGCGYGCQLHHVVYCFLVAYGTQRTLILKSQGWRYHSSGWEAVFQPLSKTCLSDSGSSQAAWPASEDTQVLNLPIIDFVHPRPAFLPLAIPKDISERLIGAHGDPAAWWISQFVKYLLRPQESLATYLSDVEKKIMFDYPIVGVHIRRTDKVGTEAAYHSLDEYMAHVIDYYKMLELEKPIPVKRVYLASDDPSVLEEARRAYLDFLFLGDRDIAKSAAVNSRYTEDSLRGIIVDIHFLGMCDYLVCTFSSQVCRVAYEIMQTRHPDASSYYYSLDDIYYFGGQNAHNQKVLYDHQPREGTNQIDLQKGDIVGIAGNHWNGYSKGANRRTNKGGLYPSFKAEDEIDIVDMPFKDDESQPNTGPSL